MNSWMRMAASVLGVTWAVHVARGERIAFLDIVGILGGVSVGTWLTKPKA